MPSRGSSPPGGATRWPAPQLLTVAIRIRPSSAARSAYSPSRPMCPQSPGRARPPGPSACALGRIRSSSRCAWTWPNPHWPSQTTTAGRLVLDHRASTPVRYSPRSRGSRRTAGRASRRASRGRGGWPRPGCAATVRRLVVGDARGREEAGHEVGQDVGGGASASAGLRGVLGERIRSYARRPDICNPGPSAFEWAAGRASAVPRSRAQPGGDPQPWRTGSAPRLAAAGRSTRLHDDATGASASVLPVVRLQPVRPAAPGRPAQVRPVLVAAADFADDPDEPGPQRDARSSSRSRTGSATARITFGGKTYTLPVNSAPTRSTASRIDAPWDVVEHKADDAEALRHRPVPDLAGTRPRCGRTGRPTPSSRSATASPAAA